MLGFVPHPNLPRFIRELVNAGCYLSRHGKRHDLYVNPGNGKQAPVPRHSELKNKFQLFKQILMASASPSILSKFRSSLDDLYGSRIERVVLFGSRAREDAGEDSDYDIAVFLKEFGDRWTEIDRLVEIETEILWETGAVINALPFPAGSYQDRTPLMHEIRREGLDL